MKTKKILDQIVDLKPQGIKLCHIYWDDGTTESYGLGEPYPYHWWKDRLKRLGYTPKDYKDKITSII